MGGIAFQVAKKKLVDYNFIQRLDAPALRAVLALPGVDVSSIKVGPPPRTPRHTRVPPPAVPGLHLLPRPSMVCLSGPTPPPFPSPAVRQAPRSVRFVCEPRLWPYLRERWEFGIGVTHFRDHAAAADRIGAFVRGPCSVPRGPAACGGICG